MRRQGRSESIKDATAARRVAWRILKDWFEAQLALHEAGQAEMGQVLLPYAIDSQGVTAYHILKEAHVKQLKAAPDNVVEGKFKAANGAEL
ncbi:MAG TPA: hypothetical protein VFH15_13575 [Pyrinomonadaceae bacterium]|nr:hypothetical protein [Pyrinomonadaceae bacterium]